MMNQSSAPTTSQAIRSFFNRPATRSTHNAPDLLDRYTADMEVQVNVAVDAGEPVAGKRNTWVDPDDSASEQWHHVRIPRNAQAEPERNDWPLKFDLAEHVEAIGMTGWDFGARRSRWFGFDFDSIAGHAAGVGVSDADLEAVKAAAWNIPWLEIRKSTGGSGLHIYALCSDDGIPTANHTEHAALGRAVLDLISAKTGYNFTTKVDACGGNMWVWHRKSSRDNEGLKLLKPATATLSEADFPGDWRSHLAVVQRKRATQRVVGVPENADDSFYDLVLSRNRVPLSDEHRRILDALKAKGFSVVYQQDNHLVQVHTAGLAQLAADSTMAIRGNFKTLSRGTDPGSPNAFMFPLANDGWRVCRFSPGTKEADTWNQGEGWTSCDFNVRSTLAVAADAEGGHERSDGSRVFDTTVQGLAALKGMGVNVAAPEWANNRELTIKPHKTPRKLIASIDYEEGDENPQAKQAMRSNGWNLEGSRADTKRWEQVVNLPSTDSADIADEMLSQCDSRIRSLKTPDGQDANWRIVDSDGVWVERDRTAAKDALSAIGIPVSELNATIARLQSRNWSLRNMPFQPEFPGGRVWNNGAQLAFKPTDEDRPMVHPTWDSIFAHVGKNLDEAVRYNSWCIDNGITTGGDYLLHWCASVIQRPAQKLPYLFFYGPQETGKSAVHNALALLMSRGHVEARNSLLTPYNGELDGAILAYIEEVDLSAKGSEAYNRIKELVTADKISIHAKYATVYTSPSHLHWIQVANDRKYCPVFEDDTRIVVVHVAEKPATDIPWPTLKSRLQTEAPDFLRTLLDLRLPDGVGRLWLPVLDTQAKRDAIGETKNGEATKPFDSSRLESALQLLLLQESDGVCTALVSELLNRLGDGPWSKDPNVFGRQLKETLEKAQGRGFDSSVQRVGKGNKWTFQEQYDDDKLDGLHEWAQLAYLANYAMSVARPKDTSAAIAGASDSPS
jgi:hypothetical protein